MPYFLILPLYLVYVVLLLIAGLACLLTSRLRNLASYPFVAALGSVPGFLASVVIYYGALFLFAVLVSVFFQGQVPAPTWPVPSEGPAEAAYRWFSGVLLAAIIFVTPFLLSGVGVLGGSIIGVLMAWRIKRRQIQSLTHIDNQAV